MQQSAVALLALLLVALAGCGDSSDTRGALPAPSSSVSSVASRPARALFMINAPRDQLWADTSRTARRQDLVVLHSPWTEVSKLQELKRARPGVKVFAYVDFGMTCERGTRPPARPSVCSAGVFRAEAARNAWVASYGGRAASPSGIGYLAGVDVGRDGYAAAFAGHAAAYLKATSPLWDGVFLDDVQSDDQRLPQRGVPDGYSAASYREAVTRSFRRAVDALRTSGYLTMANLGGWKDRDAVTERAGIADFSVMESFGTWTGGAAQSERSWRLALSAAQTTAARGRTFVGITHLAPGTGKQRACYGDLLARIVGEPGRIAHAIQYDYGSEPWFACLDADYGVPEGPPTLTGGLFTRPYQRGTLYANANQSPVRLPNGTVLAGLSGTVLKTQSATAALRP